jgi:cellulose synthase (UDP-forming)
MICLPLLASGLLKRWPRMFWGVVYEQAVCFPLFLSLFDLVLPRKLAFRVTPKGITSDKRKFDFSSSWLTLTVTAITIFAIVKGIFEFHYFGIEKDAYFFNLGWAIYNLIFMLISLLVAWERPQRRKQERLSIPVPFKLKSNVVSVFGKMANISLNGASFVPPPNVRIPQFAILELFDHNPLRISVERAYHDKRSPGKRRCGLKFTSLNSTIKRDLLRRTFASADTWENVHAVRTRSNMMMGYYFLKGIIGCFLPTVTLKRSEIRHNRFQVTRVYSKGESIPAILRNSSENGAKLIVFAKKINQGGEWQIHNSDGRLISVQNVYINKIFPFILQAGFKRCESR